MASFLIHLLIPVLMILAVGLFRPRDAWTWSWAAWAVDVDYLSWVAHVQWGWPNWHRALFHNVFWLLLAVVLSYAAWKRWRGRGLGDFALFARARPGWLLVPYFYATHIILDIFQGGVVPFWPVSKQNVFWWFEINIDTRKAIPEPQIFSDPGTSEGVPDVDKIYTWMDSQEFSFFLLYLLSLVVLFLHARLKPKIIAATAVSLPPSKPPQPPQ